MSVCRYYARMYGAQGRWCTLLFCSWNNPLVLVVLCCMLLYAVLSCCGAALRRCGAVQASPQSAFCVVNVNVVVVRAAAVVCRAFALGTRKVGSYKGARL